MGRGGNRGQIPGVTRPARRLADGDDTGSANDGTMERETTSRDQRRVVRSFFSSDDERGGRYLGARSQGGSGFFFLLGVVRLFATRGVIRSDVSSSLYS